MIRSLMTYFPAVFRTLSKRCAIPFVIGQQNTPVTAAADTNENTLYSLTIPAGLLGPNDSLRILTAATCTNNANTKTLKLKAAGNVIHAAPMASSLGYLQAFKGANRGAVNSQVWGAIATGITGTIVSTSIDFSQAQTISVTAQKTVAGDTITLESVLVELIRSAQ